MGGRQSRRRRAHLHDFEEERMRRIILRLETERMRREALQAIRQEKKVFKEEKCYDPLDNTLTFVDEEDHLDFLCEEFKSKRAAMSCGHAVTPMSLTQWCRRQLDEGKNKFVCGQPGCDAEWSYDEVRKMALLTCEEMEYFETKLFSNAANNRLDVKQCPGCQSHVLRAEPNNLNVECPMCTAQKGRRYQFCWCCLREWKSPASHSDHCGNEDCVSPLEILKNCPDIVFEDIEGVTGCPSIRACPTCGLLVEHDKTQCKHVTCRRCKVKFCFVCLELTDDCMQLHEDAESSYYDDDDQYSDEDDDGQYSDEGSWYSDEESQYSDEEIEMAALQYYGLCTTGVAPRQTSIPVWDKT